MTRSLTFASDAWDDYLYWQGKDRKTLKKVNALIKDVQRNGNEGMGSPEPLSEGLSGYWSRRINQKDRLVYKATEKNAFILQCRTHYGDK